VCIDAKFLQCGCEGGDVVLAQHVDLHLRSETVDERELGFGVRKVGESRRQVEETVDVVFQRPCLAVLRQGRAVVELVVSVGVTLRENAHQRVV
jgi:hypothetical protein